MVYMHMCMVILEMKGMQRSGWQCEEGCGSDQVTRIYCWGLQWICRGSLSCENLSPLTASYQHRFVGCSTKFAGVLLAFPLYDSKIDSSLYNFRSHIIYKSNIINIPIWFLAFRSLVHKSNFLNKKLRQWMQPSNIILC